MNAKYSGAAWGIVLALTWTACKTNTITDNGAGSATIGPQGGIVKGPDGAELRVPGGALSQNTAFMISLAQAGDYPAPPTTYDVGGNHIYAFEPHGQEFLSPATVSIPFLQKPTDPVLLRAEKGDTTWHELAVSGNGTNTLEGSVSSLSFFVVADKHLADGGASTCSGRGPAGGKPNGTVSSTSIASFPSGPSFDLSKTVSGYAAPIGGLGFAIVFADYANSCGYSANADYKIGSTFLAIMINNAPPSIGTFAPSQVGITILSNSSGTQPGSPAGQITCGSGGSGGSGTGGTGVTITAYDGAHVAGSFDFTAAPSNQLQGTFDVPVCAPDPSLHADQGWVDGHCCTQ